MRISLKVIARSKRTAVELVESGVYKVHVTAPPVDGAANEAVVKALAAHFEKPKSKVVIVAGHTNNQKYVDILD